MKQFKGKNLSSILPKASREALRIVEKMLRFHPDGRPTCAQLLREDFFDDCVDDWKKAEKEFQQQRVPKSHKKQFERMIINDGGIKISTIEESEEIVPF